MKIAEALADVERKIESEASAYHISGQVARFFRVAAFTVIASLLVSLGSTNTVHVTWSVLAGVVTGAVETAFRQVWPTVSVDSAKSVAVHVVDEQLQQTAADTAKILGQPVILPVPTSRDTPGPDST